MRENEFNKENIFMRENTSNENIFHFRFQNAFQIIENMIIFLNFTFMLFMIIEREFY